jgi:hypothetical protein
MTLVTNKIVPLPTTSGNNKPTLSEIQTNNDKTGQLREEKVSQIKLEEAQDNPIKKPLAKDGSVVYKNPEKVQKFSSLESERYGVPSLFNPYSLFMHPRSSNDNSVDLYMNSEFGAFPKKYRDIKIETLLQDFSPEKQPTKPLLANDFLYAKYYKKIPLNHLIVLRRFAYPTYDNLEFADGEDGQKREIRPIAQAITYFGDDTGNDLNSLTSFKGVINWKKMDADVHQVDGNEQSYSNSPGNAVGSLGTAGAIANTTTRFLNTVATNPNTGQSDLSGKKKQQIEFEKNYENDINFNNKVFGPVNVITSTHIRDRGIGSDKSFSIVFEYKLRSYNNINPKMAMLDLLFNMLSLTFNNAKFWGGANRYYPKQPQFGFFGDQNAYYDGRYEDYGKSVIETINSGTGNILSSLGDSLKGILSGDFSGLANLGKSLGATALDLKSSKSRPNIVAFKTLLTGLPIGEWHLTIGNPTNPIMMMGNLICEGFSFEFGKSLGADDFPDELKFTIDLKSGRPRDKADLESVFLEGQGKGYYPPEGVLDVGNLSSAVFNDANPTTNPKASRYNRNKQLGKTMGGTVF